MYISPVIVLLSLVIYLPICLLLLYLLRKLQKRLGVKEIFIQIARYCLVLLLFLLPTWEAILGKHHLDKYCDLNGGLYTNVDLPIDSLYLKNSVPAMYPDHIREMLDYGFEFIDIEAAGQVYRYRYGDDGGIAGEFDADGNIVGQKVAKKFSDYVVRHAEGNNKSPHSYLRIVERGFVLKNRNTGEIISGYRDYVFINNLDGLIGVIMGDRYVACSTVTRYREIPRYNSNLQNFYKFVASSEIPTETLK